VKASAYHFEDHWKIWHPIDAVWDVLATPINFPDWWQGVYLQATALDSAERHVAVLTKGWLPYKLRWKIETIRMEKPNLIEFRASGDFSTDSSKWLLRAEGSATLITLDWNPKVEKPIVKLLSPVLKPVFEWNHHWAMNRGEKQLAEYLSNR
jgi:Polyketide cyclase / dehydrase and lipid transport